GFGPEQLPEVLRRARELELTAAVHAIGDAAAQVGLDAIEATGIAARLEHAQMLTDADVARMARLGVVASVQPAHLLDDRDATEELWPGRADQAFRLRDLFDAGAGLVLGSDAPVALLDPWLAMAAAVHRSADEREAWFPAQQLQPREARAASTDGGVALEPGARGAAVRLDAGCPARQLQPREALAASTDGVVALEPGGRGEVVLLDEGHTSAELSGLFADVPSGADGLMVDTAARESAHRLREAEVLATVVAGRLESQS